MKRNPFSKPSKTPPPPAAPAPEETEKSQRSSISVPADFTTDTQPQPENAVQDEPPPTLEQIHTIQDLDEEPKGAWDYQPPQVPPVQSKNRSVSLKMQEESQQSIAGSESDAKNGEPSSSKPPVPLSRQSELPKEMFRAGKPSTTFSFATPRQSQAGALAELRKQMAAEEDEAEADSVQSLHESFPRPECSEVAEEVAKVECRDLDPKTYVHQPNNPALITFQPPRECEEVKRRKVSCDKNDITIGEKEKESVRAVGRELLAMGRRILDEIDLADAFRRPSPPENESGGGSLPGSRKQSSNPKGVISSATSINRMSNSVRPTASVSFDLNLPRKDDDESEMEIPPEVRGLVMRPSSYDENVQTEKVVELAYANWADEIQKSKLAFIAAFDQLCSSLGKMGAPVGEEQDGVDEDKLERTSSKSDVSFLKKERRSRPSIVVSENDWSPGEALDENKQSPPGERGTGSPPMAASHHGAPTTSTSRGTRALQMCTSNDSCVDGTEIISTLKQLTTDVSSLGGKFQELDDQVGVILTSLVAQNEDSRGKMERMEGDLMKLMRLVYEMQCAQKLQMHFGRPSQGDSSEQ